MKPIGVVRKVDQLGRIVLPKSLRKRYALDEGEPVEILVQGDQIILEKFKPRCVFCTSTDAVKEYNEKHVCTACMGELSELIVHLPV